jgi:hypothetical protein
VPAYVTDYERRYEIRFQTDVYQDLLPSQLAALVEHLHRTERVKKTDIARYIGVSPATLRNYTGLWRLLQREGLFARVVELMDVGALPSSNPYAWLRLTDGGIEEALLRHFTDGVDPETWIDQTIVVARQGQWVRFHTEFVETATGGLEPGHYREDAELRSVKRDIGFLKGTVSESQKPDAMTEPDAAKKPDTTTKPDATKERITNRRAAVRHLSRVSSKSPEPVLQTAARALRTYLK